MDIHAHYFPEGYFNVFNEDGKRFSTEYHMTDHGFYYKTPTRTAGPLPTRFIDLKQRIADMDRQGVEVQAMSLTNPMTFVAFAAIFTTMGIGAVRGHSLLTAELLGGVFLGSAAWWTLLSVGARAVRHRFDFKKLTIVNRATGVFVIAVGIAYMLLQKPTQEPSIDKLVPKRMRARLRRRLIVRDCR